MTAPIDRIENVLAQVADVERQMEACRVAGVQFPPSMTWKLLSACRSLLGPTMDAERTKLREQIARQILDHKNGYPYSIDYSDGLRDAARIARKGDTE